MTKHMTKKIYKWGIIGLGRIAHKFAQDLGQLPNAELHAVASTDLERSKQFSEQYQVPNYYGSYQELLSSGVDVVYLATPNHKHSEWAIICLQHKIAVLVEKPFAMNYPQAGFMQKAAIANRTFLMEAMWTRFLPTTKQLLAVIEDGLIGNVITIKADFCAQMPFDPASRTYNLEMGGGSLLDIGIYPVYLSLLLLGMPVDVRVVATKSKTKVDESCFMILKYPGKQTAFLHSSFAHSSKVEAYIYGTMGTIHIRPRFHGLSSGFSVTNNQGETKDYPFIWDCLGYKYEASHVMDCLDRGLTESDLHPLETSMELIRLLDAIRIDGNIVYPEQDGVVSFENMEEGDE